MDALFFGLSSSLAFGLLDLALAVASRATTSSRMLVLAQAASVLVVLLCMGGTGQLALLFATSAPLLLSGALLGLVNAVATLSLSKALATGPLALISPLSSGYSLVTMLLALCFLHETLSPVQGLTILVVLSGMVLTSLAQAPSSVMHEGVGGRTRTLTLLTPAMLFGLASMFGFGTEFFLQSLLSHGTGPLVPLFWSRLCSTLLLLAFAVMRRQDPGWPRLQRRHYGLILLIGLFDTLRMLCYSLGATHGNAGMIALLSSTYPLLPMLLGVVRFGERLSRWQWLGAGCIVLGLCGLTWVGLS